MSRSRLVRFGMGLGPLALLLVLWTLWADRLAGGMGVLFPTPAEVGSRLRTAWSAKLGFDILQTFGTTLIGFLSGLAGALVVGLALGSSRWADMLFFGWIHAFRSLPVALYVPIALVLLGPGPKLPVVLAAFVTLLYGSLPIYQAVKDYDPEKILLLKGRGFKKLNILARFILPEAFTALLMTASITITLSLAVTVVTEMLFQGIGGLGARVISAKEASDYAGLWLYTIMLGLGGYLYFVGMKKTLHLFAPWTRRVADRND